MSTKQYPGYFDFKKRRGESLDAYKLRMLETNSSTTKYHWTPRDGRGVRNTKTAGKQWPNLVKPFPG